MKTKFSKVLALILALTMVMSFSVTGFAAESEPLNDTASVVLDEDSVVSPAYLGATIDIESVVFKASDKNISISLYVPEAQPNGVFFRASIVKDTGTPYSVYVEYPNGNIAYIGVCYSDNGYIQVADYNYIQAGTYTFNFGIKDESSVTDNYAGFIAAIYENL